MSSAERHPTAQSELSRKSALRGDEVSCTTRRSPGRGPGHQADNVDEGREPLYITWRAATLLTLRASRAHTGTKVGNDDYRHAKPEPC